MTIRRLFALLVCVVITSMVWLPGCVEICGQRITIIHDVDSNRLDLLFFYDGIYDNASEHNDGPAQLRDAVANGDILFLDWPFHFQRTSLREFVTDMDEPASERNVARSILDHVHAVPVGHYRDHLDRIGALQAIRIDQADAFIASLNKAWNIYLADEATDLEDSLEPRTHSRWMHAAENDHAWVRLNGHAVEFHIPMHPVDAARFKADRVVDFIEDATSLEPQMTTFIVRALSAAPMSLIDQGDQFIIRIGDPRTPATLRFDIREADSYKPNLEQDVVTLIPADLHTSIRERLEGHDVDDAVQQIIMHGPPEQVVEAWLAGAEDATFMYEQTDAILAIREFTAAHADRILEVPTETPLQDPDASLYLWRQWCNRMWAFPLEP